MNEVAENGSTLWPLIVFGVYWAYLIAAYEKSRRNGMKTLFDLVLPPRKRGAAVGHNANWLTAPANKLNDFDEERFLADAVKTYEFIVKNYAAGNKSELVGLLSPDVFEVFSNHIDDREANCEKLALDIVALKSARIVARELGETLAEVTVRFEAEILVSTRPSGPENTSHASQEIMTANDIWTFEKRRNGHTRTWVLIATEAD